MRTIYDAVINFQHVQDFYILSDLELVTEAVDAVN